MKELVQMVAKQTGVSEEVAEAAVKIVLKRMKEKLPSALGKQIDEFMDEEDGGLVGTGLKVLKEGVAGWLKGRKPAKKAKKKSTKSAARAPSKSSKKTKR